MQRARVIKQLIANHIGAAEAGSFNGRLAASVITELELKPGNEASLQQFVQARLIRESLSYLDQDKNALPIKLAKKISYYLEDGTPIKHYGGLLKSLASFLDLPEQHVDELGQEKAELIQLHFLRWLLAEIND